MPEKLSPPAERLLEALRKACQKKRKVHLEELWTVFDRESPELRGDDHRRSRLAEQLKQLQQVGHIQFPKSQKLYEKHPSPTLPLWVQLPKAVNSKSKRMDRSSFPWAPELRFIADAPLSTSDQDLLNLQAFFREGGRNRPIVPMRERSIGIFEDEKRLDSLSRTKLFAPQRLSLESLRCYAMSPPLVWQGGPKKGLPLLVVENHHSWESLKRFNAEEARWSAVIYGAGKHVLSSVEFLKDLARRQRSEVCLYFGDLDPDGVSIPAQLARGCHQAGGPQVVPECCLYELLLQHGRPQKPVKQPKGLKADDLAWMGESLVDRVQELLFAKQRLAQEWVGWELLQSANLAR